MCVVKGANNNNKKTERVCPEVADFEAPDADTTFDGP